jgi:hypothetical protein
MKKYLVLTSLMLAFVFISISGKTTLAYAQDAPAPDDSSQQQPLSAEDARKRAMDFESPTYFPSDWEDVEARYNIAKEDPDNTEALAECANVYVELFRKTIPLYAQAREDEVMGARDELLRTEAAARYPDVIQDADKIALKALEQYEAEDFYAARDTAADALTNYETLLVGARLDSTRQEIIDRGFIRYDPENFDKADEVASAAIDFYEAGDRKSAVESAEDAILRYNVVLTNSWTAYSADRRASASAERELCMANKVNIAVKDGFREGEALYTQAEEEYGKENFETAANFFTDAEARYAIARQETEEKRKKAFEAIMLAHQATQASSETAIEAERIIEGGSK